MRASGSLEDVRRLTAICLLVIAPAAQAATVQVDKQCYKTGDRVTARGAGFTPNSTYTVFVNSQQLGQDAVDGAGNFAGGFPITATGSTERGYTFSATDGTNSANTVFKTATPLATFSPSQGNPKRLRVTFRGNGFGAGQTVYLHYLRGNKEVKRVSLGKGEGECGSFNTKRKLFPFRYKRGSYTFQYDTARKYEKTTPGAFRDPGITIIKRFS